MNPKQMKQHYVAVAAGSFLLMFAFSIGMIGLSFFIRPVSQDLGVERGAFSFYFSLIFLTGMMVTPWIGKFINKYGPRPVVITGSITGSIALALFSFANTLFAFYAFAVIMGLLFHAASVLSATTSITIWFEKKRGQMLGLVSSASGVGGVVFSFILPRFISTYGWRQAYLFLAVCWLVLTLPTGLLLIRDRPEKYGMSAYGSQLSLDKDSKNKPAEGMTLQLARRSSYFYLLLLSFFLVSLVLSSNQHLPSHFAEIGLSDARLGNLMSAYSAAVIGYKIIFGVMSDKFGLRRSLILIAFTGIIAYFIVQMTQNYFALLVIILFMAAFNPAISILPSMSTFRIFGNRDFPAIWALLGMAGTFGQFIGPTLWGYIFDFTGSYRLMFVFIPLMILIAFLLNYYCLWKSRGI